MDTSRRFGMSTLATSTISPTPTTAYPVPSVLPAQPQVTNVPLDASPDQLTLQAPAEQRVQIIEAPKRSERQAFSRLWLQKQSANEAVPLRLVDRFFQPKLQDYLLGNKRGSNLLQAKLPSGEIKAQAMLIEPNAFPLLNMLNRSFKVYDPADKRFAYVSQPQVESAVVPSRIEQKTTELELIQAALNEVKRHSLGVLYAEVSKGSEEKLSALGFKPLHAQSPGSYPAQSFILNHLTSERKTIMVWEATSDSID